MINNSCVRQTLGGLTPRSTSQNFCCQCPCPHGETEPPPTSAGHPPTLAGWAIWMSKQSGLGLPWWRRAWESACQCRAHGEDPTCRAATKPVRHNYWACALEPVSHNYWACMPQLLKPACLEPMLHNKRSHLNEKPAHHNKE